MEREVKRRRVGRPSREASQDLTVQITRTAMQMFLDRGFGNTTMQDIASRMRMSKATLYGRFPTKAAILEAGVADLAQRLIPQSFDQQPNLPFRDRLQHVGEYLLGIALLPGTIALERLTMSESYRHPRLAQIVHERGTLEVVRHLKSFLDVAVEQGELQCTDTMMLAEHLQDVMLIFVRRAAHGIGSTTFDAAARERLTRTLALLFDGMEHSAEQSAAIDRP